jgi:hypothetical protein
MDRRTRNLFVLALVGFVAVAGAAAILVGPTTVRDPAVPSDAQTIAGVVVGLRSEGLGAVTGLTLRTTDGRTLEFEIGELENGADFPPGHLSFHQATGDPVRVWYRTEGGRLIAFRLEDATL